MSFLSAYRANPNTSDDGDAAKNLPKDVYEAVITKVGDPEWSPYPNERTGKTPLQFRVYFALPDVGNKNVLTFITLPDDDANGNPRPFGKKTKGYQLGKAILGRELTPDDDLGQVIVPGARVRLFLEPKENGYMKVCEDGFTPTRQVQPGAAPARPVVPPRPARPLPADEPF